MKLIIKISYRTTVPIYSILNVLAGLILQVRCLGVFGHL